MKHTLKLLTLTTAAFIAFGAPAEAQQAGRSAYDQVDPNKIDYIVPRVAWFSGLNDGDTGAAEFGLEYRFAPHYYTLRPAIGVSMTTDGSLYGHGSVYWDIALLSDSLIISPNTGVGFYKQGDGRDLGGTVEFRSGIEAAYRFDNNHRVAIGYSHMSNASIYDANPGADTLLINYQLPAGELF